MAHPAIEVLPVVKMFTGAAKSAMQASLRAGSPLKLNTGCATFNMSMARVSHRCHLVGIRWYQNSDDLQTLTY